MSYKIVIVGLLFLLVTCLEPRQAASSTKRIGSPNKSEASHASADRDAPKEKAPNKTKEATRKNTKLDYANFSVYGFLMDKSKFGVVNNFFGGSNDIYSADEDGDHMPFEKFICYTSKKSGDSTLVVIGAGLYSGYSEFDSITLFANKNDYEYKAICSPSKRVNKNIETKSGIHLGMTIGEMRSILGVSTQTNGRKYVRRNGDIVSHREIKFDKQKFYFNGGHMGTEPGGQRIYTHQIITARGDKKSRIKYIKISMESEPD